MKRVLQFPLLAVILLIALPAFFVLAATGRYNVNPATKWGADGRSMTLIDRFEYIDGNGRHWVVPGGTVVDGASIPQVFWSLIGGPFDGKYRNASVIHDYFCEQRRRRWQDVHHVFYEAMLTSGVESTKAFLMYKAVERFGPRWDDPKVNPKCLKPDGKFDFSRCTENSGIEAPPAVMAPVRKDDLQALISEVKGTASAEDLRALQTIADKAP
jgi:hypothetical protein